MPAPFHNQVSLAGFHFEDSILTVNLATGVTYEVGNPLAIDTTAPNRLKIAGAGEEIVARLESVENRTVEGILVGAAAFRFASKFPVAAGSTLAVGDTAVGAGNGEVTEAAVVAAGDPIRGRNYVMEVANGYATVVKI